MDVGTAKATPEERTRVPHHLLDLVEPSETLSLAQFQRLAYAAIDDILRRGRVPLLVGGTGQYVMAVVEGWRIPRVPPDENLRRQLYAQAEDEGPEALHSQLHVLDPVAADRIDPRNVRRVIRALEVCLATGINFPLDLDVLHTSAKMAIMQLNTLRQQAEIALGGVEWVTLREQSE